MVLSKPEIEGYLARGDLRLDPAPQPAQIKQVSVDLRLGRKFTTFKGLPAHIPHVRIRPSIFESQDLWEHFVDASTVQLVAEQDVPAQLMLMRLTTPLGDADVYGADADDTFQYQSDPIPRDRRT